MKAKITLTLSKEEIGEIIKKHLRSEGYEVVGNFGFDFGSRLEGYGQCEHDVPYFDGCSIEVKKS